MQPLSYNYLDESENTLNNNMNLRSVGQNKKVKQNASTNKPRTVKNRKDIQPSASMLFSTALQVLKNGEPDNVVKAKSQEPPKQEFPTYLNDNSNEDSNLENFEPLNNSEESQLNTHTQIPPSNLSLNSNDLVNNTNLPKENDQYSDETKETPSNVNSNYVPYYTKVNEAANLHGNKDPLLEKLNYVIHLLEEEKDEKTENIGEEVILYGFLGVFVIFVVDSFARVGKYVR